MTDTLTDRLFTPPRLPSLGLDLAILSGGGAAPAQFSGETRDGRAVFCRYRGGWLSVCVAREAGGDAIEAGDTLLQGRIGPPLHGSLSLGQLCCLTGMTIRGGHPDLPTPGEMRENVWHDLSGARAFYDVILDATPESVRRCLARLVATLPHARLLEHRFDERLRVTGWLQRASAAEITTMWPMIVFGAPIEAQELATVVDIRDLAAVQPGSVVIEARNAAFTRPPMGYFDGGLKTARADTGLELEQAGIGAAPGFEHFLLKAEIPAGDGAARAQIATLNTVVDACFPKVTLSARFLDTGAPAGGQAMTRPLDPVLADCMAKGAGRYFHISAVVGEESRRWFGVRP